MISGVGVDIVEIRRINEAMTKHVNFIDKMFSKNEIEYLKSRNLRAQFVAGRFAAKEAVAKALGTGFRGFNFKDIVIDRNALGKPLVVLKGKARTLANKYGEYKFHLSISHERENAIAYVIFEGEERDEDCNKTDNEKY